MKASILVCLATLLATAAGAAEPQHQLSDGRGDVLHGGVVGGGKAARDTTYLLGGPGRLDGKFQDAGGNADWQGWTHLDATYDGVQRWNISSFESPTGTPAMWCGQESFPSGCGPGYGNSWNERLVFTYTVADPGANTVVRLECVCRWDCEPGFDYLRIQQNRGGIWQTIIQRDDVGTAIFDQTITFTPSDYVGPAADRLELRFQGFSDGAWSDEDCLYDTDGLAQVDDIRVTIGAETFFDDFDDGESHHWTEVEETGCGDFAKIWQGLQDIDPCVSNYTPQVAFIDDGIVVPGTGGTPCISWCYGPGGYIVNWSGGLRGPSAEMDNLIISPALAWPAEGEGASLSYDVFRHEELISGVSPGIFYQWHVRSAAERDGLASAPWEDRNYVYYGKSYLSDVQNVTDLLVPGRAWVQIGLRCLQYNPFCWGTCGDGTPAPYFDNVALKAFAFEGPALTAREIDLAQDDFPDRGVLDLANLANDWVRFDMARSISPDADLRNDPGDSILVDIGLPRVGSVLEEMPKLVVKMKANPLFDGVRVLPAGFTQSGGIVDGWVYGDSTWQANGTLVRNRYHFDLPDSGFFFPGDVIHYHIEARDNVGGNVGVSTLPADISAFGDFDGVFPYGGNSTFIVQALPTLRDAAGAQPTILYWNDAASRGGENEWAYALDGLHYAEHVDYDVYTTNGPSSGVGNGLGGRATAATLGGYDILLYTSGDLGVNTIANNDYGNDPSNDLGVLNAWFQQGGKKAFLTGDDLAFSLGNSGSQALAFRAQHLGLQFVANNLLPLIENQTAPAVVPVAGNSIFTTANEWRAYGGCPGINDFDAVEAGAGTERLAEFMTSAGVPGYTYAAASRRVNVADVVFLPHDFSVIHDANAAASLPARARVLDDVLTAFGASPHGGPVAVPDARVLTVSAGPNPFNPRTTIALDLPRAGEVSLRVFDIRGRLVRTLQDGPLAEGRHELTWNGDDDNRRAMASGVYFYEARAVGEERIGKLTLVR